MIFSESQNCIHMLSSSDKQLVKILTLLGSGPKFGSPSDGKPPAARTWPGQLLVAFLGAQTIPDLQPYFWMVKGLQWSYSNALKS